MQVVRLVAAFIFVFGLLGLLAFVSRRRSKAGRFAVAGFRSGKLPFSLFHIKRNEEFDGKPAPLRVLKRTSLSPTHQLHLISIDAARLLICTHPSGCTVLHEMGSSEPEECASGDRFLAEVRRHAG